MRRRDIEKHRKYVNRFPYANRYSPTEGGRLFRRPSVSIRGPTIHLIDWRDGQKLLPDRSNVYDEVPTGQ